MRKALFLPYRILIAEAISKIKSQEQVTLCGDMIDHLKGRFYLIIPIEELHPVVEELYDALEIKRLEIYYENPGVII